MSVRHVVGMRSPFILLLAVFLGAVPALFSAEQKSGAREDTWAEIKLPYEQLQRMWQATQSKPDQATNTPPISALIKSAEYELSTTTNGVTLRADYVIENLTDQWQALPLLGGDAKLASVDSTNTTIAWQKNTYTLLTQEPGTHYARSVFSLPRRAMREGIKFVPGPASVCSLRAIGLPKDQALEIPGHDPSGARDGAIVWHFPGSGGEYQLRFTEPRPAPPPVQPSRWSLSTETFLTAANGRLQHDCLLHAMAASGSALEMNVRLPAGAAGIVFKGDDGMEGRALPRTTSYRVLQLRWKTRDLPDRRVELSYWLPAASRDEWSPVPPQPEDAQSDRALIALPRVSGMEVTPIEATAIDQSRISSWLRQRVGERAVDLFESTGAARFGIRWLPRIQTAQAMVSEAVYETRLVDDGAMLIVGKLTIEHRQGIDLSLTMPTFEEVLTGKLNGAVTQPIRREESMIEFPLPANAKGKSELEFSYAAQGDAFDAVSGRQELQLPMTDLFVHSLRWRLDIPDRFRTSAIQGNVVFDSKAAKSDHDLQLVKRLIRREHPSVQIHYRRRGLDD